MCGLTLETCMPNLMSASLAIFWSYEHLTTKNLGDHVTLDTPFLEKKSHEMLGQSLETCLPNLKSVALQ